ncbi:WSCD family member-like protein, partial [Dinothrombium tinctorium]
YLTGSVYKDYLLLRNGFPAESVANGSVIIVKTHEWGSYTRRQFDRAILLIRNPFKTLLAEFNRRAAGHLAHASPDRYLKGKGWKDFAVSQVTAWSRFTLDWLNFTGPLLILRYEDVVNDIENQLYKMFAFLNVTVRPEMIKCVIANRDGVFKRPPRLLPFDPFSASLGNYSLRKFVERQRVIVYEAIKRVQNSANYTNYFREMFRTTRASTRHLKNVINVISSFVGDNTADNSTTDSDISFALFTPSYPLLSTNAAETRHLHPREIN